MNVYVEAVLFLGSGEVGSKGERMFSNVGVVVVDDFGEVGLVVGVVAFGINVRELAPLEAGFEGDFEPYPSHWWPNFTQRIQLGFVSSHFTLRILEI